MIKNYLTAFSALFLLLLSSCSSIESIPIEYMSPASLTFPDELKKVGIVNNSSAIPDNKLIVSEEESKKGESPFDMQAISYANGNAAQAAQSLAEEIANQNYFESVVICDSALRANDRFPRVNTLSQEEVQQLTADLGVDFLISVENVQMKLKKTIIPLPEYGSYLAATDATVYPIFSIYLPMRNKPMTTLTPTDSIFWEAFGGSIADAMSQMTPDEQIIREASEFAGTIPVKLILPEWEKDSRYIYTGGSSQMRDASIYVRENSWDKAYELWHAAYTDTKSEKKLMKLALNIAVYYEMNDDLAQAQEWAAKAQQHADKAGYNKVGNNANGYSSQSGIYLYLTKYIALLDSRNTSMAKLKLQLDRLKDDF